MVRDENKKMEKGSVLEFCVLARLLLELINIIAYCSIFILMKSFPMRLELLFSGV